VHPSADMYEVLKPHPAGGAEDLRDYQEQHGRQTLFCELRTGRVRTSRIFGDLSDSSSCFPVRADSISWRGPYQTVRVPNSRYGFHRR
jgi:hypothetical protein